MKSLIQNKYHIGKTKGPDFYQNPYYFHYDHVKEAILKYKRYIELFELYSIGSYCPDKFEKEFGSWCDNPKYMLNVIFGDL